MQTKIAIYGATNFEKDSPVITLVQSLTKALLAFPDVVLISGGFQNRIPEQPENVQDDVVRFSIDKIVLEEAERMLMPNETEAEKIIFKQRFETWIPKINDRAGVKRFEAGKVVRLNGSSQSRRFRVVQHVDAIVTIGGEGNTRSVIELALALNKPVFPVPCSSGDSESLWKIDDYKADILVNLGIKEPSLNAEIPNLFTPINEENADGRGVAIAKFIRKYGKKKCLVLMPFSTDDGNAFYKNHLESTIADNEYTPHRIDYNDVAGNIPDLFFLHLDSSKAVIVDITGSNPNVMYELGHIHSKDITPLILIRSEQDKPIVPFYLQSEKYEVIKNDEEGHKKLRRVVELFLSEI